jgi:hypothetical protein
MKKVIFLMFALTSLFSTSVQAQYDKLEREGYFKKENDLAYGSPNRYDNQYPQQSGDRRNITYSNTPNDRYFVPNEANHAHHECSFDNRTANQPALLLVRNFEVERLRKDGVEIEFELRGPDYVSYTTQWRGNTLYVFFDYPNNGRSQTSRRSEIEINLGRLRKDMNYDVIAIDATTNMTLGRYSIN